MLFGTHWSTQSRTCAGPITLERRRKLVHCPPIKPTPGKSAAALTTFCFHWNAISFKWNVEGQGPILLLQSLWDLYFNSPGYVCIHSAAIKEKKKKTNQTAETEEEWRGLERRRRLSLLAVNLRLDAACGMTSARTCTCVCVYARVFHCARV